MDKLARYFIGLIITLTVLLIAFFLISIIVAKVQNTTLYKLFQLLTFENVSTILMVVRL